MEKSFGVSKITQFITRRLQKINTVLSEGWWNTKFSLDEKLGEREQFIL